MKLAVFSVHTANSGSKGWTTGTTAIAQELQMKSPDFISSNSQLKEPVKKRGNLIGSASLEVVSLTV
jgi:hypothetical protein